MVVLADPPPGWSPRAFDAPPRPIFTTAPRGRYRSKALASLFRMVPLEAQCNRGNGRAVRFCHLDEDPGSWQSPLGEIPQFSTESPQTFYRRVAQTCAHQAR